MNIEGLDYNTQREKLILPEYGREMQKMVDYAVDLPTKAERQRCAESIVEIMERMFPQNRENPDYKQKLWDHLALMSNFKLDIDWPFDISEAQKMSTKPEPLPYPMSKIPVRHYGKMIFEIFEKLKTMEPGAERDELVRITANQMKQNLLQWSHGSSDDEKVADDLARYTDGKIQLDLDSFKFDNRGNNGKRNKRK
jgi:hypothetical protein